MKQGVKSIVFILTFLVFTVKVSTVSEKDFVYDSEKYTYSLGDYKSEIYNNGTVELAKGDMYIKILPPTELTSLGSAQTSDNTKIELESDFETINLYMLDDGFEYEIVLSKNTFNTFRIPLDSNLAFYYQAPLDEENHSGLSCNATHCLDGEEIIISRPENVIHSYAVYDETGLNPVKLYHIYRPKAIDNNGAEKWGNMTIKDNTLIVSFDNGWLSKAAYPVTIDPEFGYTTIAQTFYSMANQIVGTNFTSDVSGTAENFSWYIDMSGESTYKCAIYKTSDSSLVGNTTEQTKEAYTSWVNLTFDEDVSIESGVGYVLACWSGTANCGGFYDAGTNRARLKIESYGTWPDPITFSTDNAVFSTFLTVTEDSVCDCPESGDWEITGGEDCELSADCDISGNQLRVLSGTLNIPSGYSVTADGCFVQDGSGIFVADGGGLFCGT